MDGQMWKCQKCGHEVCDNEGETGEINGVIERDGETYADDPCVECGGEMKLEI